MKSARGQKEGRKILTFIENVIQSETKTNVCLHKIKKKMKKKPFNVKYGLRKCQAVKVPTPAANTHAMLADSKLNGSTHNAF